MINISLFLKTLLVCLFTDWPWETVKYISMPDTIPEGDMPSSQKPYCKCRSSACLAVKIFLWCISILFRLSLIVSALFAQFVTCFRRDRISTNATVVTFNNASKIRLSCDEKAEIILSLLIPDILIVLLAVWVYFGLKFGINYCCECCGWEGLKVVMKADRAENLNELVQATREKLRTHYVTLPYILIPLIYIVLSQVVSGVYLYSFDLGYEQGVVIRAVKKAPTLSGDTKYGIFSLSFIGFIALDLLYLQVILRYAYRCQMVIYYLKIIEHDVEEYAKDTTKKQLKKETIEKTEKAYTFIKQLNASSGTIALLIVIAVFQAVNCAIIILYICNDTSYLQIIAVAARLLLWGFLAVFPFHKAAGVNIIEKQLCDLGWRMKKESLVDDGNSHHISLRARVFGKSVNPWLPYLIVVTLLFTVIVGAKIKWYEVKL